MFFLLASFNNKRGVHQGNPLSPFLFIIVLELLAISTQNNRNNLFSGSLFCRHPKIIVNSGALKWIGMKFNLVTFADDITTFVCNKPSHLTLIKFNVINLFGTYSGLKINHEKTEILLLSNKEVAVRNF